MKLIRRGRHDRKGPRWKRILIWTILSGIGLVFSIGFAGFIFVYHTLGKIGQNSAVVVEAQRSLDIPLPDQPENILVMGVDQDPDGGSHRSDTMMLVRINPQSESLSVLSIPRDLIVTVPGRGQGKINSAYAYGGVPLAIQTVRNLTGEPVHHFIVLNYNGFSEAVDSLGGIYVDVDKRYFNDNSNAAPGNEYDPINIEPGYRRLNGKDALAFVRYRHTDSDLMRIKRQQRFIHDAKSQSLNWGNLTRVPELADTFASNTTSDIGRTEILSLTRFLLDLNKDHIYQQQVPVYQDGGGDLLLDTQNLRSEVARFDSPDFDRPAPQTQTAPPSPPQPDILRLPLTVKDGGGGSGAAARAADLLKQKGFASVEVAGDAPSQSADNQIYYGNGDKAAADELAALLSPSREEPFPAAADAGSGLVVIIGSGFTGELAGQPAPTPAVNFEPGSSAGISQWQSVSSRVPFSIERPTDFPREFSYEDGGFYSYNVDTDDGPRPALKVVALDQSGNSWGIMETRFTGAPLLDAPSVQREVNGKSCRFYYEGDTLRYLAWQDGDTAFWISNSLQDSLSEDTMVRLAASFRPL